MEAEEWTVEENGWKSEKKEQSDVNSFCAVSRVIERCKEGGGGVCIREEEARDATINTEEETVNVCERKKSVTFTQTP